MTSAVAREPTPQALGKQLFRVLGSASANLRPLPDFLLIGAKRGGTTSMYYSLLSHPQVLPMFPAARWTPLRQGNQKGVHYFDTGWHHGSRWYRSHFPTVAARVVAERLRGAPVLSGEASPYYLFQPLAADRARHVVPQARIVALLRDPVDRAFSHWKEQRKRGHEPLETFQEAVDAEPDRIAGEHERLLRDGAPPSFSHEHQSYVTQGEYARNLRRWLDAFPPHQVLVTYSDRFYADPQASYDEVVSFLGLRRAPLARKVPRNPSTVEPVPERLRRRLYEHYEPHDRELADLLGVTPPWRTG